MTATQLARAERRRRQREREQRADVALGAIFIVLLLVAFAIAGTVDAQSHAAYQRAFAEQNGVG